MVRVYAPEVKGYYVRLTQQGVLPKPLLKLELIQVTSHIVGSSGVVACVLTF